jgi:uncharacterized LabA/DUF88 family protein
LIPEAFCATATTLGFDVDYKRLLKEFENSGTLVRAFYYTAIVEDHKHCCVRPLIITGYTLITRPAKEFVDATGRRGVYALRWFRRFPLNRR